VVRVGSWVSVSGTTATDAEGRVVGQGNAYAQTVQVLKNIQAALEKVGARFEDVVRTRMFVRNIDDWKEVGRAHAEFFEDVKPAATLIQVASLLDARMLVEIEVDAILADAP